MDFHTLCNLSKRVEISKVIFFALICSRQDTLGHRNSEKKVNGLSSRPNPGLQTRVLRQTNNIIYIYIYIYIYIHIYIRKVNYIAIQINKRKLKNNNNTVTITKFELNRH